MNNRMHWGAQNLLLFHHLGERPLFDGQDLVYGYET